MLDFFHQLLLNWKWDWSRRKWTVFKGLSGREELKVIIISSHFWKFVIPFVLDLQNNIIWIRLNEEKESLDFAWLRNGNGVTHAAVIDLHFYAYGWGEKHIIVFPYFKKPDPLDGTFISVSDKQPPNLYHLTQIIENHTSTKKIWWVKNNCCFWTCTKDNRKYSHERIL